MSPHPLRLLFVSYGLAGLAAFLVPETTTLQAILIFWLGGAGLALPLATVPGLSAAQAVKLEATPSGTAQTAEYESWDDDLAEEAMAPSAQSEAESEADLSDQHRKTG